MKILNFGSLNLDYVYMVDHMAAAGETLASEGLQVFCGGKGLNQSIALCRAGAEVWHAGAIGEDGEDIARLLQQERRERQLQRFGRKPAGQAKEQGHVERIDQTESGVGESIVRTHVLNEVAPYHAPHAKGLHPVKLLHAACGGVERHGRSPLRRGGGPGYRRNGSLLHAVFCDPPY